MKKLLEDLNDCREGKRNFTLILKDPLGHSFLQNPDHPYEDKNATRVFYKRTKEENDIMGLSDMKTEGYNNDSDSKSNSEKTASPSKEQNSVGEDQRCVSSQEQKKHS